MRSARVEHRADEKERRDGGHEGDDDDGDGARGIATPRGRLQDGALLAMAEHAPTVGAGRDAVARALHGPSVRRLASAGRRGQTAAAMRIAMRPFFFFVSALTVFAACSSQEVQKAATCADQCCGGNSSALDCGESADVTCTESGNPCAAQTFGCASGVFFKRPQDSPPASCSVDSGFDATVGDDATFGGASDAEPPVDASSEAAADAASDAVAAVDAPADSGGPGDTGADGGSDAESDGAIDAPADGP